MYTYLQTALQFFCKRLRIRQQLQVAHVRLLCIQIIEGYG